MGIAELNLEQSNNSCHLAYTRFFDKAPYLPRCSDNKTAAIVRPKEYAVKYPYMQVNRPDMVSWLVFDLDHSDSLIWESEGLPAPNMVVRNRDNGHCHLYYAIVPVCISKQARSKPIQYMKAVYQAMAIRLNADLAYSGPVAKTPRHPWWLTWEIHNTEYELGELADYVDLVNSPPWAKKPDYENISHSRHELLFEELRFYAYSTVNQQREKGSFSTFCSLLDRYAHSRNNFTSKGFDMNLTIAQVRATVKSVARWTWDKYTGGAACNRGIMRLDNSLSLKEKQLLSAKRTHHRRQKNTESKIEKACLQLSNKGQTLSYVSIAREAGLTRQTVAKYKQVIDRWLLSIEADDKSEVKPIKVASSRCFSIVKYGVHQITALASFRELNSIMRNIKLHPI